ncbi:MAG: site-2 protease family protein [Nanoarchaeota archaeon]|nr:site-2 protease family protein [Nanoarchaeota archaeon]
MNWDLISAIVFYSIVALLIFKYRHKFEVMEKIFIVHKTKKGLSLMHKLSKYKIFWKTFSTVAIPVSVFFMLFAGKLLFENLIGIFSGTAGAGVGILIPGVKIPGSPIYVPFWQGIISIAVLAIVHEFAHGIVAAMEGIKIKSTGFGFLAILPLAFVELDEKQLKKINPLSRMRILASGAFANVVVWALLITLIGIIFVPFLNNVVVYDGLKITSIDKGMPAEQAGLSVDEVILSVNNKQVKDVETFLNVMKDIKPGEKINIQTNKGNYTITTVQNPKNKNHAYIGITVTQQSHISQSAKEKYGILVDIIFWIFDLLRWIAMINLLVGIMNFLPIWVLDGGRIVYDLLSYVIKDVKILRLICNIIFSFYSALLLLNIFGPLLMKTPLKFIFKNNTIK